MTVKGGACPTDSGFIADQDRATIAKSFTLPRDSAPRVTSPAAEEGRETIVPIGSGFIPTAGPPATIISTGSERRPMSKKQKREYYMAVIKSNLGWRFKDFKGMTFEEIEAKFAQVWKQVEDFIPMGSKEEAERLKRKRINLEKEQLVPVKDIYVQALQVKHPIID
nr:hypothetical protein [Tanacetum cinerariifolium]